MADQAPTTDRLDVGDSADLIECPVVSVVMVTWNCRDFALRCIRAVMESQFPGPIEVIVVDNASADGTQAAIAAAFPDVIIIGSRDNLGFAGATNLGIRTAAAPYVLLLNPDAFPCEPTTFGALLDFLSDHPHHAAAGCRLVFPDGRHQVGDAGFDPSLRHIAAWSVGLHGFWPGLVLAEPMGRTRMDVDWLCGACMMVRMTAIREVGMLDESYFMYGEDVEWGCRLRRGGWGLAYLPDQRVVHLQGGTQTNSGAIRTAWIDSLGALYRAQPGPTYWRSFCFLLWAGFALRGLIYATARPRSARKHTMFAYALHARSMLHGPPKPHRAVALPV